MTRTPMNAEPFILRKATSYLRQGKPNDTGWAPGRGAPCAGQGVRSSACWNDRRKDFDMTEKLLFTGKTHNTSGRDGGARSSDGQLDIKLKQPHPAAENLFGAAWSACYMGALEVAASQRNIKLPAGTAVDAEIDLNSDAGSYFLRARLNVSVPGVDPQVARELLGAAHSICPYSKATHGNINVATKLL